MAADYCSLPMNLMELMALMQMKSMAFSGGAYLPALCMVAKVSVNCFM